MGKNLDNSLICTIENGIQKVIFNRPRKKNALTIQMYKDLVQILNKSAVNDAVRILVITGSGDFYSSGNDFFSALEATEEVDPDESMEIVKKFVDALITYPKLLIAILNGPAIGIAATTLALFDIVYASEKTYLSTPFSKLGLVGEGCSTYTYPKVLGPSKAAEMLYFGQKLTAEEGEKCGLFSKVYKSGSENEVWNYLQKMTTLSNESILATKRLAKQWDRDILLKVNEQEIIALKERYLSPGFFENIMQMMSHKSKM